MARSLSLATVEDLIKVLDKDFVPGSTFSASDIAQDCGVRLCMPVLPSDTTVDLNEICSRELGNASLAPPMLESTLSPSVLDEISKAA